MKKKQTHASAQDRRSALIIAAAVVLTVALAAGGLWFLDYTEDDGLIYPNVYAFGENLGGMTPEEAALKLHALTDGTYAVRNLTVQLPDSTLVLPPSATKASLDVQKLVQLAHGYGRSGSRWENAQARRSAEQSRFDLDTLSCLTLDQGYIRDLADQLADSAASKLSQSQVTVTGETPELHMTMEEALENTEITHKLLTIRLGTPDRTLDTAKLVQSILDAYAANDFAPIVITYDEVHPDAVDLLALLAQHGTPAVDAVLNEKDYTITDEVLGYGFDPAGAQALLDGAAEGETVTIPFEFLAPARTRAAIEAELYPDILGSVSSYHTNSSNRNTNLRLACQAINGMVLTPGQTFSYNDALGERTAERGYKPAGSYVSGKTVDTLGGGICQVSSSLYYACLQADLEIVQRTNHGYTVSYVPYGMDATVSWDYLDYKFRNNTDHPIRILAWLADGQVHVALAGVDDKPYYVKVVYETVEGPISGKEIYEDYPYNNPEGYKDGEVIQTAYTGRTVKTYRCKYEKGTDNLLSTEYEATSRYSARDQIIARVAPPPTEPTT